MRTAIKNIFLIVNIVLALLLVGCYACALLNFEKMPVIGLLNLVYPFLFFINFFFILFWLCLFKKYFLISLIAILIRVDYIPSYFQFSKEKEIDKTANGINIMSFNLHAFRDLKEWKRNPEYVKSTLELAAEWNPDIICMQEFYSCSNDTDFNTVSKIKAQTGIRYHYASVDKDNVISGNIIFSRYPVINKGCVDVCSSNSKRFLYIDILKDKDTLRVYNFHLASFKLDDKDAKMYDELRENFESEKGKTLAKKLSTAQKLHYEEVKVLKEHTASSPYRNIICGDFNDPPASYAYQKLSSNMHDAFREAGSGTGSTYNGHFPAFRIDYILLSKDYRTLFFQTKKVSFSDHFPIFAMIEKKN